MGFLQQNRIFNGSLSASVVKATSSFLGHQRQLWPCFSHAKNISHHQRTRQVYLFENTKKHCFHLETPYKTLDDIKQLGVKTVKGGFRRRPELIKQKQPEMTLVQQRSPGHLQNYGLFDKCERIQHELTEAVLKMMNVPPTLEDSSAGSYMLDIGCGHGWSLTLPSLRGFCITGVDLDLQALAVVQNKIDSRYLPSHNVHAVRADISRGFCFRENTFDVAISVSFLQWLCVGQRSRNILQNFFQSLSFVLKPEGKAGIQFYPRNSGDVDKVISESQKYFKGALVSDFPHLDRGRKLFLLLLNNK